MDEASTRNPSLILQSVVVWDTSLCQDCWSQLERPPTGSAVASLANSFPLTTKFNRQDRTDAIVEKLWPISDIISLQC